MTFDRIKVDPKVMGGVPAIRDPRMPVATIVNHIAAGRTSDQILDDFPELEAEDIKQALPVRRCRCERASGPLLTA